MPKTFRDHKAAQSRSLGLFPPEKFRTARVGSVFRGHMKNNGKDTRARNGIHQLRLPAQDDEIRQTFCG